MSSKLTMLHFPVLDTCCLSLHVPPLPVLIIHMFADTPPFQKTVVENLIPRYAESWWADNSAIPCVCSPITVYAFISTCHTYAQSLVVFQNIYLWLVVTLRYQRQPLIRKMSEATKFFRDEGRETIVNTLFTLGNFIYSEDDRFQVCRESIMRYALSASLPLPFSSACSWLAVLLYTRADQI